MKKSRFYRHVLFLVIGTIMLYGLLNTIIFVAITGDMFTEIQLRELKPRAVAITDLVIKYQKGTMDKVELSEQFANNDTILNRIVYVYDQQGNLLIKNDLETNWPPRLQEQIKQKMTEVMDETLDAHLDSILSGQQVEATQKEGSEFGNFLVVGHPIKSNGIITGAIFLIRPPEELATAFLGLHRSMILSSIGVFLIMIFPVYRITRYIVKPLYQMRDVAINMANGNLTEYADEAYKGEIGELGHSLNYLSKRLSETIFDLKVEQNRLKQTIDGLSEGIVAISREGNITHVNPAIHSIFGIRQEEDGLMGLIPNQGLWEDFNTVLLKGEMIVRSMQWKQMVLRIMICPIEDELNTCVGVVGLFRDVTESERLEQSRREYVDNVSHELRTPVSAIRALSETLLDDMVPDEDTKKRYYGHILHETMRLTRLINDLLTLSRLQSDGTTIKEEDEFQVNELMADVAERYTLLASEKEIEFSYLPLVENIKITSNLDLVEQVLIIILDNAMKYTQPNGSISLYGVFDDHKVRISVSDTGTGIHPEDLPHIFERFYKNDKAHANPGTGLGLAIAYEIMQSLSEDIYVTSELEKGSTFTITLSRKIKLTGK
ncbi:MAG: PAS domain-containing sensor histidine kinase [Firmicutes bacterium HGW-Firmicutes-7]|nr:MAG: PAS domain-containing sensor histidine kinase [Firmicutes bacterium HGW-Firmicutes-7]